MDDWGYRLSIHEPPRGSFRRASGFGLSDDNRPDVHSGHIDSGDVDSTRRCQIAGVFEIRGALARAGACFRTRARRPRASGARTTTRAAAVHAGSRAAACAGSRAAACAATRTSAGAGARTDSASSA